MNKWNTYLLNAALFLGLGGSFFSTAAQAAGMCLGVILFMVGIRKTWGESPKLLAAFGVFLLTVMYGAALSDSFKEGFKEARPMLYLFWIPYLLAHRDLVHGSIFKFLRIFALVEFALALWASISHGAALPDDRMHGFRHYNTDSYYVSLLMISLLPTVITKRYSIKSLLFFVVMGIFLFMTKSRAAFYVLGLCTTTYLVFSLPKINNMRLPFILLVLVALAAVFGLASRLSPHHVIKSLISERGPEAESSSMGTRYQLWRAALTSFRETRGVGIGYGNYDRELVKLIEDGKVSDKINTRLNTHNDLLHTAMCAGAIGVVGWLVFIVMTMIELFKFARKGMPRTHIAAYLFAAYLVLGLMDSILMDGNKVMFLSILIGLTLANCYSQPVPKEQLKSS